MPCISFPKTTPGDDASVASPVHGSGEQPATIMESQGAQAAVREGGGPLVWCVFFLVFVGIFLLDLKHWEKEACTNLSFFRK